MHYNNESNNDSLNNGPQRTVTTKGFPEKGLDPNFVGGSVNASNTTPCINDKKLHTNSLDSCNTYRSHNQEIHSPQAAEWGSNKIPLREVYDSKSPERHYLEQEENLMNRCYHSPDHGGGGGGRRKRESAALIQVCADNKESEKENIPLTDDEDADGDDEAEDDLSLDIYELDDSLKDELERSMYAESEELRSISSQKSPLSDDEKVHFDEEEKAFAVSLHFSHFCF